MNTLIKYISCVLIFMSPAVHCLEENSNVLKGLHNDIFIGEINGFDLSINIAFPEVVSIKRRPVLILIHGGGFISGDKNLKNEQIKKFSKFGFVSASAMYRLSPDFRFPAPVEDIQLAIRFLKANAERYHIDPNRIIVSGSSAGSYLAVMAGVVANSSAFSDHGLYSEFDSSVRAVAAQSAPVANFSLAKYQDRPTVKRLAEDGASNFQERLTAMSPITYLDSEDPPFFLSHGDADPLVPVDMSREFVLELKKIKHSHEYHEVEGGTHSLTRSTPEKAKEVYSAYLMFLQKWAY